MKKLFLAATILLGLYCSGLFADHRTLAPIFKEIYKKNLKRSVSEDEECVRPRIPKKIHQIWIGPKPVPNKFRSMMQSWQGFHPSWEYKLWTNEDLKRFPLINREAFDAADNWGMKSDILRYEILYYNGGVYVDLDFECVRSFDELNYLYDFYAGLAWPHEVNNALIGSVPGSPVMYAAIQAIKYKFKQLNNRPPKDVMGVLETTGPIFFSYVIADYYKQCDKAERKKMMVLPVEYFYAFPNNRRTDFWQGRMSRQDVFRYLKPEAMAIHYWATSWQ